MNTDEDAVPQLSVPPFRDRKDAGESLADSLAPYQHQDDVVVLGLPRSES